MTAEKLHDAPSLNKKRALLRDSRRCKLYLNTRYQYIEKKKLGTIERYEQEDPIKINHQMILPFNNGFKSSNIAETLLEKRIKRLNCLNPEQREKKLSRIHLAYQLRIRRESFESKLEYSKELVEIALSNNSDEIRKFKINAIFNLFESNESQISKAGEKCLIELVRFGNDETIDIVIEKLDNLFNLNLYEPPEPGYSSILRTNETLTPKQELLLKDVQKLRLRVGDVLYELLELDREQLSDKMWEMVKEASFDGMEKFEIADQVLSKAEKSKNPRIRENANSIHKQIMEYYGLHN